MGVGSPSGIWNTMVRSDWVKPTTESMKVTFTVKGKVLNAPSGAHAAWAVITGNGA